MMYGTYFVNVLISFLGDKHKATTTWNGILEKFEKKLSTWKRWICHHEGRQTLNSVFDSISTYIMYVFPIPEVVKKLDKIRGDSYGKEIGKNFHVVK